FRTEYLEKINLSNTIEVQGNAAKELVEEIDIRHNHALLVQKIGQITSTIVDIDQLTWSVVDIIKAHLDFDRGLLLLSTEDRSHLYYQSGYRYTEPETTFLHELSIDLEKAPSNEILAKAFNNQQPYLINDLSEFGRTHDLDLSFFEKLRSAAVICIPIIYKKKSLGILALDNIESKRMLAKSDMSLLMGIASQIAVGINNTISFNRLRESEKELQVSRDELELRVDERTAELKQVNKELRLEIEEREKTEKRLRATIKEKEILMREVYHRVKNNLQIIASLLEMTKRRARHPETKDMLSEAHAKIYTMSLIHTQLYQSDRVDQINMGRNLHNLVDHLAQLYGQNRFVRTEIDTESFYLSVTQAVPCALALNEIISNAFKYAYPGQQSGKIELSQKISADDMVCIAVKDYGKGIPDSVDIENTDTLGIKLVRNLILKQLNGELVINNRQGTEILIRFKAQSEDEQPVPKL
ncbi:MAG: GAF domain-containing protein, partial [Deltaproteobacteria bacterium]|nr:GAF domain-containing protein [Deltaproteobacteria bacterium]